MPVSNRIRKSYQNESKDVTQASPVRLGKIATPKSSEKLKEFVSGEDCYEQGALHKELNFKVSHKEVSEDEERKKVSIIL
jgi:hypothetical protein